jgi:hypothetical protein
MTTVASWKPWSSIAAPCRRSATPSDFPLAGLDMAGLDSLPVPLAQIEDIYPLSPMQQGMLFHTLDGSGADLHQPDRVPVQGLDLPRFEAAWNQVIARHEILRTGFCAGATWPAVATGAPRGCRCR